jgi:malate dehydrogenase (oxaloacetate-decarboxylating)(NADP+)
LAPTSIAGLISLAMARDGVDLAARGAAIALFDINGRLVTSCYRPGRIPEAFRGRRFVPGQGNNVYIFPATGMAVFATEATRVTDEVFIVAAQALAQKVTEKNLSAGLIYPPQSHILETSLHVAERIATCIFDRGLAGVRRPADVGALIHASAYRQIYRE